MSRLHRSSIECVLCRHLLLLRALSEIHSPWGVGSLQPHFAEGDERFGTCDGVDSILVRHVDGGLQLGQSAWVGV